MPQKSDGESSEMDSKSRLDGECEIQRQDTNIMRPKLLTKLAREVVPRPLRNWLRSPSRSAEWLWDSAMFSIGTTKTLQLGPNLSLICHPRAYRIAYRDQVRDPEQGEEFRNFVSYCGRDMSLFDIGSHYGIFSLVAAHFGGTAIAVDPSPTATRMIRTQADLNKCTDRIQIIQAAVSNAGGEIDLLSTGVFSDGYFQMATGRSKREVTRTGAITIDQMVRQFGNPTHIKIDVEGHEAAVLRGASAALKQISPLLFVELHNEMIRTNGGDPASSLDELAQLGYETFTSAGDSIQRSVILDSPIIRIVARRILPARQR